METDWRRQITAIRRSTTDVMGIKNADCHEKELNRLEERGLLHVRTLLNILDQKISLHKSKH